MKHIISLFILFVSPYIFSQAGGLTCPQMEPICTDAGVNFQANSNGPDASVSEPGNNYDCLFDAPNPSWFYLEISDPGDIIMNLSAPTDIDFVIWGPYPNLATAQATCGNHQNVVADINCDWLGICDAEGCSYSPAANENPGIPNAQVGEVYVLLITNYANNVQNITLTQTGGSGSTDCTILTPECLITYFEGNISACINGTGTYDVTGVVEFEEAPTTGTLIVEDCFGTQHVVATAPFPAGGTVNYTIPGLPANGAACDLTVYFSAETTCQNGPLNYTAPTCDCFFTNIEANISACNPANNSFSVSGLVEFTNPPAGGQLIIEDCNGNQQVFNAPFTSPTNYNITGLDSDGTLNCELTAYFTANAACTINVGPYNNPNNCTCGATVGTFTDGVFGDATSSNPWLLCFGDELDVIANGDFDVIENTSHPATYDPGIWLLVYDCPPTVGPPGDINTDPCLLGVASTFDQAWTIANTTGSGNTLYFVPVTMYSMVDGTYAIGFGGGDLCYDLGPTYPVTFLPEVTSTQVQDCQAGTATVTVNGGAPAFDGSNFTASNLAPASATFNNTTAANGGTITISGLVDGDNWSFDITDNNGCPITVSGVFQGVEDPAFTYPDNTYCQTQLDPAANITGTPGGTFTSAPAGLVINAGSGLIDLSASTPGTYTVTYTTPDPICFDTETFVITVNPEPAIDPLADQVFCESFTFPAITGTSLTGNQAYYTDPNGAGTQYNPGDVVNFADFPGYPVTVYIYDETGTTPNCTDEVSFQLTINITPILDTPADAEECNEYVLPAITGTNLSGNEAFYTAPNGGGTALNTGGIVNTPGTTTYYVYDETGSVPNCFNETSFTVTINLPPTFALAYTDPTACAVADGTITISGLDPTTNYDITYSANGVTQGPTGMMSDGAGNIVITGLGTGSYTDFVVNLNGCTTNDNTLFNLVDPGAPFIDAGPNQTVCDGVAVTLTANNPDGANIAWNNGITDGVPFNQAVGTTVYTVTATLDGCVSNDQVSVTVNPLPIVDAGVNQVICEGEEVTLTADNPNGANLNWDNGVIDGTPFTPAVGTVSYTVTADLNGCISTDQVDVTVTPNPVFNVAGTDPTVCGGNDGFVTLSGLNPGDTYVVIYEANGVPVGPANFTADGGGNIIITGLTAGNYTNFLLSLNDCPTLDNTPINLVDPNAPVVDAGPDVEVCEGEDITLTAVNPEGAIITWNNGVNDGVPFNQAVGTVAYTVTANLDNCISTDVVNVTVHPTPTVFAGNDVTVCDGQSVVLTGTGAQSYVWTNGVTNGVAFTPAATQTYTVTGTSQFGCVSTDDVTVNVEELPEITFEGDVLEGCTPVTTTFTNTSATAAGSDCVWYLSDGTVLSGCDNVAQTFTTPGCYDVTLEITTANGCTNSSTLEDYVCVYPYPVAYFTYLPSQPTTITPIVNFSNGSIGASNYQWFFGDGATSNAVNPTHNYGEEEGSYEVTLVASTPFGCTDTARSIINIVEELIFYVPNTFTPDGDEFNETFQPVFTSGFDPFDFHLMIFNRWGELIFESYDASIGWDGTYGGKASGAEIVKDGTYVWKIEVKTKLNDERKMFVGHVNVLR